MRREMKEESDSSIDCTRSNNRNNGNNKWARVCDTCQCAPCTVYCRADAAYLCTTCDADIHSANPLARRHQRVPVSAMPNPGGFTVEETVNEYEEDETASWLLLNPLKNNHTSGNILFGGDEYLDLMEYNSCQDSQFTGDDGGYNSQHQYSGVVPQKSYGTDSIVPVKTHHHELMQTYQFGMEYETSNTGCNYPASLSHSVSMSSIDVGIVPESTISDVSNSHPRTPKGTIDLFSSAPVQVPTQLTTLDREARVLRYREKKKMRKFEKTIRYASRKAYAETRPRIKGRFAKRTDTDVEVDQMFNTSIMAEGGYGIVPSF